MPVGLSVNPVRVARIPVSKKNKVDRGEGRRLRLTSHTFRLMHTKGERGGARGHRTKLSLYLSTKTEGSSAKNRAELTSPY